MTGFSWTWAPGYGNLAQPLNENLRGKEEGPLDWDETCKVAFDALEEAVTAPELGSVRPPNMESLSGYMSQRVGAALGMLGQIWTGIEGVCACITAHGLPLSATRPGSQRVAHLPPSSKAIALTVNTDAGSAHHSIHLTRYKQSWRLKGTGE